MRDAFRRLAATTTIGLIALCFQVITSPEAGAEACGPSANHQVGFDSRTGGYQPIEFEGIQAALTDQGGYVLCSSDTHGGTNFSTSWIMVLSNDGNGFSQTGTMYRYGYGSCVHRWSAQSPTGPTWSEYELGGCSTPHGTHTYTEKLIFNQGRYTVESLIDNIPIVNSRFAPLTLWKTPLALQISSETEYATSHVPGFPSAPQTFASMQVQNFASDAFVDACGNLSLIGYNDVPTRWAEAYPACNEVQSWTK